MKTELINAILKRASDSETIHDMAEGLSPAPRIKPKASPEQIAEAESRLGFEIPKLLKTIYSEIGNGGFGPGYGLYSLDELVNEYKNMLKDTNFTWDKNMLPICTWGCTFFTCVDVSDSDLSIYFCDIEGDHCLDDNSVSFELYDKDGNLVSTENPFTENTDAPRSPEHKAKPEVEYQYHTDTLEELFTDWSEGVDLWEEVMGYEDDLDEEELEEEENEEDDRRAR